jgi:uncharacterized RDD family membrane protein YckC
LFKLPLVNVVQVSTPFNIDLDFEVAPIYRRLAAWMTDIMLMVLFAYCMRLLVAGVFFTENNYPYGLDILMVSMPLLLYHLIMELVYQGQSLGKKWLGIRVLSLEGGEPKLGQYLIRWIFRVWEWPLVFGIVAMSTWSLIGQLMVVCAIGLPVIIVISVTARHQRLGDLAAGTTMVDVRTQFTIDDTIFQNISTENYKVYFPEVMRLSDRDINAIKSVLTQTKMTGRFETAHRIAGKVKEVLSIESRLEVLDFLEKLLDDYNYLATKNK